MDGTFGRGGHSRAILQMLGAEGRLFAFDKDPEAVAVGRELEKEDKRFSMLHASFADVRKSLSEEGIERVNGVLLDLGVSSPQLDSAERGFSFMQDGPLDMRMDNSSGMSAADWINNVEESEMIRVFREYGEERFARRMASAVVRERKEKPFSRTAELAKVISEANPAWEKGKHPATRVFQAIRICINSELQDLQKALTESLAVVLVGGRMVVISFHSLEDRIVKRFFRDQSKGKAFPPGMPVTEEMLEKKIILKSKAIKASADELKENIRSRSAVMRVAEKICD